MRLEVGGQVEGTSDGVEATVEITNSGALDASTLDVRGELFGRHDAASLGAGVAAGRTRRVLLRFPGQPPRPGVYAVPLRLDYEWSTTAGGRSAASQRAYLLVGLGGAQPPPAVELSVGEVAIDNHASLPVTLKSADGAAHRIRLRALTPRGLNPWDTHVDVDVPAHGETQAGLPLLRGGAPRPSRQGVLVVASTLDGDLERTAVATGVVNVTADWWWVAAYRPFILGGAALLLLAATLVEWRARPAAAREAMEPPAP